MVTLSNLDEDTLVEILSAPKNSLVKQYTKLFEMDDVELEFTEDSLRAIAKEAIERNTGARGLRAILEDVMKEIMFDVPSDDNIMKVKITAESLKTKRPDVTYRNEDKKNEETA